MDSNKNLAVVENYYQALIEKKVDKLKGYLHEKVEFVSPMSKKHGVDETFEWVRQFAESLSSLKIRSRFVNGDQVMMVYDIKFPGMERCYPSAALIDVKDGLISKFEVIFDSKPFTQ